MSLMAADQPEDCELMRLLEECAACAVSLVSLLQIGQCLSHSFDCELPFDLSALVFCVTVRVAKRLRKLVLVLSRTTSRTAVSRASFGNNDGL